MAAQPVQDRLSARFNLWDTDHNGQLERSDFEAEGRRVLQAFGETENSPRGHAVMNGYNDLWNYLADKAGGTRSISRDQFERVGADIVAGGAAQWAAVVRPHITAMVQLCDTDGDGQITRAEFAKWLHAVGADTDAADTFNQIDADGDGYLSIDELSAAVEAYSEGRLNASLLGI
ncbi:EF-hand domain-containing protein [Nocardia sp. NPDC055053]